MLGRTSRSIASAARFCLQTVAQYVAHSQQTILSVVTVAGM
jgi:hypothetical protein